MVSVLVSPASGQQLVGDMKSVPSVPSQLRYRTMRRTTAAASGFSVLERAGWALLSIIV